MTNRELLKKSLYFSSLVFSSFTIVVNTLSWFLLENRLLPIAFNYLLFCLLFLIFYFVFTFKKQEKIAFSNVRRALYYGTLIFSVGTLVLTTLVYMIKNGLLWKIHSVYALLVFALAFSFMNIYIHTKWKLLYNFLLIGAFYYLIFITIATEEQQSKMLLVMALYVGLYALYLLLSFIIFYRLQAKENSKKEYHKQF